MKSLSTNNRRDFLKKLGLTSLGAATVPFLGFKESDFDIKDLTNGLRPDQLVEEEFWEKIKKEFTSDPEMVVANSANLCPAPKFILDKVDLYSRELANDVSFQHRGHFREKRRDALVKLGDYLGVSSEDIGITRNTSEANNIVVNGLDLEQGDEVLIWDQNHPSNNVTWKQRAKRMGFTVKEIKVPKDPKSKEELSNPFLDGITSKTRLIAFSHISNVSGIALPVQTICQSAKRRGVMTLVDGAQSLGVIDMNLIDMGCSFYTASTHKWLMGPMENGILFVNRTNSKKLWPNIMAAGWKTDSKTVDERLCVLGQRNTPSTAALSDIVDFHMDIGKTRIEDRVRELNGYLRNSLEESIPNIEFVSPLAQDLSAGVTIITIPGSTNRDLYEKLYSDYKIVCATTGGLRFSPTINTTIKDMDRIVFALNDIMG